jgi:hypothetical protein
VKDEETDDHQEQGPIAMGQWDGNRKVCRW